MEIAITGSTGLVGSALVEALESAGHTVRRMVRRTPTRPTDIPWRPSEKRLDPESLAGVDAVVNLAGEPLAQRWSDDVKRRIRDSRVGGTRLLAESIAALDRPPRVLVSGSAMGIYGDRGDERLDETSAPGAGFLADVATEWEEATRPAATAGTRVVLSRTGLVLSPRGGALAKLLLPFKLGAGGRVGSGRQWVSWIGLTDMVSALRYAIDTATLTGPINASAPNPVTNAELADTLADVLNRPALVPVPAFAMKIAFGEMGEATLLASQRMQPARLIASGFRFQHPTLAEALRHELGR